MISGHYTGELKTAIDDAAERTTAREGAFYSILNNHGFYDVDDECNGLTQWQRDMVPEYNQRRMSELASAISEMIQDFLGNEDYGVMTTKLEEIINKLDGFLTCTKAQSDGMKTGMAGSGILAPIAASGESMYTANAAMMGLNPYDIDILPPLLIGIGGLPISLGACFEGGHFTPDWTFLYEHELKKDPQIYTSGGALYIGAGIPLDIGGSSKMLVLKSIFSVITANEDVEPVGDMKGGITEEQFAILLSASNKKSYEDLTDDEKNLSLTTDQMRLSYFKYCQMTVWGAIINKENWPYYHWGMLSHNSCPVPVKTAMCNYLKTTGFAVDDGTFATSAYLSYCLKIGMYYKLGYAKQVSIAPLKGDEYILNEKKCTADKDTNKAIVVEGLPRNDKLANKYFTYMADILSRKTYATNPSDVDTHMRKCRVDEANLIYDHVGFRRFEYGDSTSSIDSKCKRVSMISRNLGGLFNATILVHKNQASNLPPASDVTIDIKADGTMHQRVKNILTHIARLAGVKYLMVTSLYRSPEKQGEVMFNNMQKTGQPNCSYAAKGRAVNDEYARVWYKYYGKGDNGLEPKVGKDGKIVTDALGKPVYVQAYAKYPFPVNSDGANEAKAAMIAKCKSFGFDNPVSNHTRDPSKAQCVDIATSVCYAKNPKVTEAQLRKFATICYLSSKSYKTTPQGKKDNSYQTLLTQFFAPKGFGPKETDPCIHLEVSIDDPNLAEFDNEDLDMSRLLPTEEVKFKDLNMLNDANWDNPLAKDHNDKANAS